MPFVRISLKGRRSEKERQSIGDCVHRAWASLREPFCRDRGAVPRLRGRWERRDTISNVLSLSALCISRLRTKRSDLAKGRHAGTSQTSSKSVNDRAQRVGGSCTHRSLCSPRPRKRGSAPRLGRRKLGGTRAFYEIVSILLEFALFRPMHT
jgi:hypothetical protein